MRCDVLCRVLVLLLLLFAPACNAPVVSLGKQAPSQRDVAATTPDDSVMPISISAGTTHIVQPLRDDGYPDYIAALDQLQSDGVTPWNNYAVELISAFGPSDIEESIRQQYLTKLGAPDLLESDDYLIGFREYLEQEHPLDSEELLEQRYDRNYQAEPWKSGDFPELAAWHERYSKRLDQLHPTARHTTFYTPLIAESDRSSALVLMMPVTINYGRDCARWLLERSMLRLGKGNIEGACADILAVRGLARFAGEGPLLLDVLVGHAIDSLAHRAIFTIAGDPRLTKSQVVQFRAGLAVGSPRVDPLEVIDVGERFVCLDGICGMVRAGPDSLQGLAWAAGGGMEDVFDTLLGADSVEDGIHQSTEEFLEGITPDEKQKRQLKLIYDAIDWNLVLATCNEYFDRLHAVSDIEDPEARDAKLQQLREEIETLGDFDSLANLPQNVAVENRRAFSRHVAGGFVELFTGSIHASIRSGQRTETQDTLADLAFALAEYRIDHGEYPKHLDALSPKYVQQLPIDAFSGAAIRYVRNEGGYRIYSIGFNRQDEAGGGPYTEGDGDDIAFDVGVELSP